MKIRYQVRGMNEFRYRDSLRFIFSIFIFYINHLMQEFACPSAIDFRVYYLRNFVFRFPIDYN